MLLALCACRATAATSGPAPTTALSTPEAPPPSHTDALVRAREAPRMPTCEATDAITAARLSPGIAARPSLARSARGGLVAFITDPHGDGATKLDLLALDAQGSPTDEQGRPRGIVELADAGESPDDPQLLATSTGWLLAWRAGPAGRQRLHVRPLDVAGVPTGEARAVGPTGWLGAPTLHGPADRWTLAVTLSPTRVAHAGRRDVPWATQLAVIAHDGTVTTVDAPEGSRFDVRAPRVVTTPSGPRVYATVARLGAAPGDERALAQLDGRTLSLVARDLDHPAALTVGDGVMLAWRARMTRHDASARAVRIPFAGEADAPPVTLATFRGSFDADVALAPMGANLVGAFTITALSDDAAGSLNVSLLDAQGAYVGRAPVLTGFPTRSTEVVLATPPEGASDDTVWLAIDGRDSEDGGPELLLTRARCDSAQPRERLDVPPPTFEQDLTPADAAPVSLARGADEMRCQVRGTGELAPHVSGTDDDLAHTEAAVAVTPTGAALLAITRASADAPTRLVLATVDAQSHASPARPVVENPAHLLAFEALANGSALAVVSLASAGNDARERIELVTVRGNVVARARLAGLHTPTSAAVSDNGSFFVVADDEQGRTVLAHGNTVGNGARVTAPVIDALLRPGDALLDVVREGSQHELLVGRPDAMGGEVARSVARITLGATPLTVALRDLRDPFADPLGHPRETALFARSADRLAVLYDEHNSLRMATLDGARTRDARGVLDLLPGGGDVLAASWSGRTRWLALRTGETDTAHSSLRPVTLAAVDERGEAAVTTRLPEDPNAIVQGTVIGTAGDRVVMLHPRTGARGGVTWAWLDATCNRRGGGR